MKKLLFSACFLASILMVVSVNAQGPAGKFGSLTEKKMGPKTIKVPYTEVITYLGYAAPDTEDAVVDGKKFYYIYMYIPAVAPEIGVRMMSPAGSVGKIKNPIKSSDFDSNSSSSDCFDTYITLERSDILTVNASTTAENAANAKWIVLAKNDDSSEMPKNCNGSSYNSLLRYKSDAGDPQKALTKGLYRIGFTTYKKGEVKGTFNAQVGAPIKLPGVAMAKTIDELKKQMEL